MDLSEHVSGLIIVDRDLTVVAVDRFFLDGIGYPQQELAGKKVSEVLGAPLGGPGMGDPLSALSPEGGRIYTRRVSPSGEPRTLRISAAPLRVAGGENQVMLTVEDVTRA